MDGLCNQLQTNDVFKTLTLSSSHSQRFSCKVVLNFATVVEILKCDHSNESC